MTVEQLFEQERIESPSFIQENFEGDYWESAYNFVNDNWYAHIDSLTLKQSAWLTKIFDDCAEKRITKRG